MCCRWVPNPNPNTACCRWVPRFKARLRREAKTAKNTLDVVDHHELTLKVYDEDQIGSDDLIGGASFSLLEVYKKGFLEDWAKTIILVM